MTLVTRRESIYRINANLQLALRLPKRGLSCCVIRTRSPKTAAHRASRSREIRKIRKGISAPAATGCATRTYARVCVRTWLASEKFFHRSSENCVGMVNGRHERTGPISHAGRTHPENSGREIGAREKGGSRVSALRLPPPRPLPDPRGERSLACERNGDNVVTIFCSRGELIESGILG